MVVPAERILAIETQKTDANDESMRDISLEYRLQSIVINGLTVEFSCVTVSYIPLKHNFYIFLLL